MSSLYRFRKKHIFDQVKGGGGQIYPPNFKTLLMEKVTMNLAGTLCHFIIGIVAHTLGIFNEKNNV